jgi:hypothetical protein
MQTGVAWTVQLLTVAILAGLLARRRYRACYSFVLYLLVILVADLLRLLGPSRLEPTAMLFPYLGKAGFSSRTFWFFKELMITLLRFAVALELGFRAFRSFPGARSTARGVLFVLLTVTLVSVILVTPQVSALDPDDRLEQVVGLLQPRVLNGTVWLLTGMAGLILWYRLPVDHFHKAILLGLVPYLLIFAIGLNRIESYDWKDSARELFNAVYTMAFLLLLAFWAKAAWAPFRAPAQAREPAPVFERQTGYPGA